MSLIHFDHANGKNMVAQYARKNADGQSFASNHTLLLIYLLFGFLVHLFK